MSIMEWDTPSEWIDARMFAGTIKSAEQKNHGITSTWFVMEYMHTPGQFFIAPGWTRVEDRQYDQGPFSTLEEARAVAEVFMLTGFSGREGKPET